MPIDVPRSKLNNADDPLPGDVGREVAGGNDIGSFAWVTVSSGGAERRSGEFLILLLVTACNLLPLSSDVDGDIGDEGLFRLSRLEWCGLLLRSL